MKTIRRFYLYITTLVALEVMIWSGVHLLRLAGHQIPYSENLASNLALIIVSGLVFFVHWYFAQRESHADWIRAVFLYLTLTVTLIPSVQALLVFLGHRRGDLWALPFNLLAAAYFYQVLRDNQEPEALPVLHAVRRWALYFWLVYGLGLFLIGAYDLLAKFSDALFGYLNTDESIRFGLTAILLGALVWEIITWLLNVILDENASERVHPLRQAVFYTLALTGALIMFGLGTAWLSDFIQMFFPAYGWDSLKSTLHNTLPAMILGAAVWGYHYFACRADAVSAAPRRSALARTLVHYVLLSVGLGTLLAAALQAVSLLVALFFGEMLDAARFGSMLAMALTGGTLWYLLQKRPPQAGANPRVRRVYLYFFIFVGTIGAMISAADLLRNIFLWLLTVDTLQTVLRQLFSGTLDTLLFAGLLWYHASLLRQENRARQVKAGETLSALVTAVLSADGERIAAQLQDALPGLPVHVQETPAETRVLIIDALQAGQISRPEGATCIVLPPQNRDGWVWLGQNLSRDEGIAALPNLIRAIASGETPASARSGWRIAGYIALGFLAVWILFTLASLLISISF